MAVADHSRTPRGTLRVGANEATCLYVLPEVFAEYCRRYPPVQINIYRNFSYKITEKLENGSIEVGFLTLPIQSPSLEIQPIFRDKLMLMVSPKNPMAKHKTASVHDIVKHPLLLPKTGHTRRLMDKLFRPSRRTASSHGTAQHRHDQELCGRRPRGVYHQRVVRPR
jgi:LysR family transcriptional regulator, low CO2-responsive transcriptional regulator